MEKPTIIVGIGEMGGVFARGFLRAGLPVFPVTRSSDIAVVATEVPDPAIALIAVGEAALHAVLGATPDAWRDRLGLIQNELLPRDWESHGLPFPTVAAVWFEKKPGRDVKVIIPTPVAGPAAPQVVTALAAVGISGREVSASAIVWELVRKNLYILTANIAGLVVGGTTGRLWNSHRDLAEEVSGEVLEIQRWLVGESLEAEPLVAGMAEALLADPEHGCTGRSAPARLARALEHAAAAGITVPALRRIAAAHAD